MLGKKKKDEEVVEVVEVVEAEETKKSAKAAPVEVVEATEAEEVKPKKKAKKDEEEKVIEEISAPEVERKVVEDDVKPAPPAQQARRNSIVIEHIGDEEEIETLKGQAVGTVSGEVLEELQEAKNNGTILWAEVTGSTKIPNKDSIMIYGDFKGAELTFPEFEYFEKTFSFGEDFANLSKRERLNRKDNVIQHQLGAHIPFIVKGIGSATNDAGETITMIGVSRTEAMKKMRDSYFVDKAKGEIQIDDLAYANVVSVYDNYVLVECLGVETRIDSYWMSDEPVDNCADIVRPGDKIKVRIRKLYVNDEQVQAEGKPDVYLAVTRRMFANSEQPSKYLSCKKGSNCIGIIHSYNEEKKRYSALLKNGVNVSITKVDNDIPLCEGDRVLIRIDHVNKTHVIGTVRRLA